MKNKKFPVDAVLILTAVLLTVTGALLYGSTPHYGTVWNLACGAGLFFVILRFRERDIRSCFSFVNVLTALFFALSFYLTLRQRTGVLQTWCGILLLFAAGLLLMPAMRNMISAIRMHIPERSLLKERPGVAAVIVFLYAFVSVGLFWLRFLPYGSSPDIVNQMQQIRGEIAYCDVHAIGHTLFLKLVFTLTHDLSVVILLQLLMCAFLYALFALHFVRKGIPFSWYLLLVSVVTLSCETLKPYVTPWKDVPYLFCLGILTWLLLRRSEGEGNSAGESLLFGVMLAGSLLFRLNGIVIVLVLSLWLLFRAVRYREWKNAVIALAAFVTVYGGVQFYAYRVLETRSPDNGFSVQVFGTAIAAAVNDGKMTAEERRAAEEILPVTWMEEKYADWQLHTLIWEADYSPEIEDDPDNEVFNNRFVLSMGAAKKEVVMLYFRLLPRHYAAFLKNIIQGTRLVWGHEGFSKTLLFLDPSALLLGLILMLQTAGREEKRSKIPWLVLSPVLLNTLSIAISTVTNEDRYLLPTVALFPVLACVLLGGRERD